MKTISLKAYAKINLGLDVLGTLPNGYHEVRMIMQSIGIYDKVNLKTNRTGQITINTNLSFLSSGKDNLAYRAAELMKKKYGIKDGIDIDLYKYIPVAAGMAGGSTDAAAVFRGINEMCGINAAESELMELGVSLGADIPYCIMGGTALAEGIGERLTRIADCPFCYIVVAKPYVSVSTKFVYDNLVLDENTQHPDTEGIIESINGNNIKGVADRLCNVLESVTIKEYPEIEMIKKRMKECGAVNSLMSGSGPTVFGIFTDREMAEDCNNKLRESKLVKNIYVTEPVNSSTCRGR